MVAEVVDYVVGVDTHRDEHTLALIEATTGAVLGQRTVAPRQMLPSERSRPRCSSGSRSPASPSSPTRLRRRRVRGLEIGQPGRCFSAYGH
jgi:hypothetical protein